MRGTSSSRTIESPQHRLRKWIFRTSRRPERLRSVSKVLIFEPDLNQSGARSGLGLVSRVTPVHTAMRSCTRDEVAFGDYDAMRLRQFASVHGGALVEKWQLFGAPSLFSAAAE